MIKIENFIDYGFLVTWKLISIGFKGSDMFKNQLGVNDILDYAILKMQEDNCEELVYELACEYPGNVNEIDDLLKVLAKDECSDEYLEFRKWRIICVSKKLQCKNENLIYGLMELAEI